MMIREWLRARRYRQEVAARARENERQASTCAACGWSWWYDPSVHHPVVAGRPRPSINYCDRRQPFVGRLRDCGMNVAHLHLQCPGCRREEIVPVVGRQAPLPPRPDEAGNYKL